MTQKKGGGQYPGRQPVGFADLKAVLGKLTLKAGGFDGVARAVFAEGEFQIKLPGAVGKSRVGVFSGQTQQLLIAVQHRRWPGEEGAVDRLIEHQMHTFEEQADLFLRFGSRHLPTAQPRQPAEDDARYIARRNDPRHLVGQVLDFGQRETRELI